ncbi:MAG TPA: N-acetylglucosamine-6-phosphate deacetylase [candidate division Zixibacteria bacterium]|nr:N-acetylglucosamine-6-phosphate deacetylase [candidate division Zixibacteria bacterium]
MLIITNATIITPATIILEGTLIVEDGRIQSVESSRDAAVALGVETIDARGLFLVPGFIDLQINGAFGYDFTKDPDRIWDAAVDLVQYGTTAFLPTIVSSSLSNVQDAQDALANKPRRALPGAKPLGLHIEGPFLNPAKKGAHNPAHLRLPTVNDVNEWRPETGIRLVTLAPELIGALEVIKVLVRNGVVVSAGHTHAGFEEAKSGIEAGIRYATHVFNGMPALHHREPAITGAILADERVTVGLINDGIHVHPALVKLLWQLLWDGRLNLVTDAISALGKEPGTYRLGDVTVTVTGETCRLSDGTLAGSILSLDKAMRNLISYSGCSLGQALRTITATPAAVLGFGHQKGQIAPGFDADLVLLTADQHVAMTIVDGEILYRSD